MTENDIRKLIGFLDGAAASSPAIRSRSTGSLHRYDIFHETWDETISISDESIERRITDQIGTEVFRSSLRIADAVLYAIATEKDTPVIKLGGRYGIPDMSIVLAGANPKKLGLGKDEKKPAWPLPGTYNVKKTAKENAAIQQVIPDEAIITEEDFIQDETSEYQEIERSSDILYLYTDGSVRDGIGAWCYAAIRDGEKIAEASNAVRNTTSTRMELMAAVNGLQKAAELSGSVKRIVVRSDYKPLVDKMSEISKAEPERGLQAGLQFVKSLFNDGKIWKKVEKSLSMIDIPVTWEWVKGHSGEEWNTYCDKLASRIVKRIWEEEHREENPIAYQKTDGEPFQGWPARIEI